MNRKIDAYIRGDESFGTKGDFLNVYFRFDEKEAQVSRWYVNNVIFFSNEGILYNEDFQEANRRLKKNPLDSFVANTQPMDDAEWFIWNLARTETLKLAIETELETRIQFEVGELRAQVNKVLASCDRLQIPDFEALADQQPTLEHNAQKTHVTRQNTPAEIAFKLVDQNGDTITNAAFQGKPTVIFFGFTHCPDVCPTTLFEMDAWLRRVDPDGDQINAYFVTVDPERDTYDILGSYISNVTDRVTGISGDPQQVHQMAKGFDVYFEKVPINNGDYTIDHTTSVYLLDDAGHFQGTVSYGEDANVAVKKLKNLL